MRRFAQLNEENVVHTIVNSKEEIIGDNIVEISPDAEVLGKKWDGNGFEKLLPVIVPIEKQVKAKDILQSFPLGTKRKLEKIRSTPAYDSAEDIINAVHGDTADLILAIIASGDSIDVMSQEFTELTDWMKYQELIAQSDVDKIKGIT